MAFIEFEPDPPEDEDEGYTPSLLGGERSTEGLGFSSPLVPIFGFFLVSWAVAYVVTNASGMASRAGPPAGFATFLGLTGAWYFWRRSPVAVATLVALLAAWILLKSL